VTLLSIGDQVKPGTYRFHSRFNRVVNFEHQGLLIAVVDVAIGPGPLNIVLRGRKRALAPGPAETGPSILKGLHNPAQGWIASPVPGGPTLGKQPSKLSNPEGVDSRTPLGPPPPLQITSRTVFFAGHRYHFTSRQRYDSTLNCPVKDLHRLQHNLSALGDALKEVAPPKSLAFLLDRKRRKHFRGGFERAFVAQIMRGVDQVFHGHLLQGIRHLKGCGLGLTPGGDDFIAGLLIGVHLVQRLRTPDPLPDSGEVWNLPVPRFKLGASFPLTPALSLGERENHLPRCGKATRAGIPSDGRRGTLSRRERAGVRGNRAHAVSTARGCLRLRGQEFQPAVDAVFRAAQGDNIFSNTSLGLARRGLLFGRLKELVVALTGGRQKAVGQAARKLFAVGETSGADLATGLFMTLRASL